MHKDIRLARSMADELACPAFAAVVDEWLTRAADLGYQRRDIAALYPILKGQPPGASSAGG
jgi:3-hydroxyisobutyrate dehydrogenase-like beta-hydroxyacid dehydrogenase